MKNCVHRLLIQTKIGMRDQNQNIYTEWVN